MAEPVDQAQALPAGERTERPSAVVAVMVLLVAVAFVAGCRTGEDGGA